MKKILLLCFLMKLLYLNSQEINFSHNNSWYSDSINLILTNNSNSTIYYTLNGEIPNPGHTGTNIYINPITITSLENEPLKILNNMSRYAGDTSLTFQANWHNYNLDSIPQNVRKKTIIRACSNCNDLKNIYTRSYGISYLPLNSKWEIEILFETPSKWWHIDTGHYAKGDGLKFDISNIPNLNTLGIDSITMANFELGSFKNAFNQFLPSVWGDLPTHFIKTNASLIIYKNNAYFKTIDGKIRVNGGSSKYFPLKGLKFYADKKQNGIPFLETKNLYLRKLITTGIPNAVINETAFLDNNNYNTDFLKVSKEQANLYVSFYNGLYFENFGSYNAIQPNDKKFAKKHLKMVNPESINISPASFGSFFSSDTNSTFQDNIDYFKDSVSITHTNFEFIKEKINVNSFMQLIVSKAIYRVLDAWDNNFILFCENNENCTTFFKDDDGGLKMNYNGFNLMNVNFLGFYLTQNISFGNGFFSINDSINHNNWATQISRTVLYYSNDSIANYYQNMLIDIAHNYQDYNVSTIIDKQISFLSSNYDETTKIDFINNDIDSLQLFSKLEEQKLFTTLMFNAFLKDWIEVFHNSYDSTDIISLNIKLDDVFIDNNEKIGHVEINTLKFNDSGNRFHFRDFPVTVKAVPHTGWSFVRWVEYPDSNSIFTLVPHVNNDVNLTPVFKKKITSLSEIDNKPTILFPNPTNGIVYLYPNTKVLSIFNSLGEKFTFKKSNSYINISHLDNGIYIIKFKTNDTISYFNIVKQ